MSNNQGLLESYCGPVELKNDCRILPEDFDQETFNDNGYVVRARTDEGDDVHLWMFMYRQIGKDVIIDNEVCQTLCIHTAYSDDEKRAMHDTLYENKGQNIDDYHKVHSLKFNEQENQVTWSLAGRIFHTKSDGTFHVEGEHAGVKVDLHFTQRGDAFYHCGQFEKLSDKGEGLAGYVVHAQVKGTITIGEKKMTISKGHGIHERIIMGGRVPQRLHYMAGRGSNWSHAWGEKLSFYILTRSLTHSATFMLNVDGETITASGQSAWLEEVGFWLDPKTNQTNPRQWRLEAQTEKGRLESTITAYGRGFYTWTRQGGTILVHQFVADAETKFTRNDGSVIEEKQVASLEYMRTLYIQPSA